MNGDSAWRIWWRRGFAAFLGLALVVGLYLSYRPSGFSDQPDVALDDETTEPAEPDEPGPTEAQSAPPTEATSEDEAGDDDAMTKEEAKAFIAAARDPEETTVQVLDAGGGSTATTEAAEAFSELGYDVVAINSSRTDYPSTTVLFTRGNKNEAQALRAREPRVAQSQPNERLSDAVDLHVVVGPDWSSQ